MSIKWSAGGNGSDIFSGQRKPKSFAITPGVDTDGVTSKYSPDLQDENLHSNHVNMDAGRMDATEELGAERTTNFFERAISESRRMNAEVEKSNRKLDVLHKEFGMELVNSWQAEHASEVLQPHEAELVKRANYQS